jgi:hypothetical protein
LGYLKRVRLDLELAFVINKSEQHVLLRYKVCIFTHQKQGGNMTTKTGTLQNKVLKNRRSKNASTSVKIKPNGLYGLYKGKITLNGTSNEVFNLGL